MSYWWGKYKTSSDYKQLDKFLKQFNTPSEGELKKLIASGGLSQKSWILLANVYSTKGEFEKSIEIYNELLKVKDENSKQLLFLLGTTYYKAGFLERARQIFLEILKTNPRTIQALHYLLLVYEQMRNYKDALDVLEPLEELGEDITKQKTYLLSMSVLNDPKFLQTQKVEQLIQIYKQDYASVHLIFEYLFRVDPKRAWENFDSSQSELLVDLLWQINIKDLDLDIITKNSYLRELYSARGDLNLVTNSNIFEFDVLINLRGKSNATLKFDYFCDNCKHTSPFAFNRCSVCHSVDNLKIEFSLVKDYSRNFGEENNSFQ
ncbi:MAG: hypothetical protein JXQ66_04935 [Campylobacterales bacterium]|nr:hypothetical protein [Campylobacterales bacterium]